MLLAFGWDETASGTQNSLVSLGYVFKEENSKGIQNMVYNTVFMLLIV